MILLNTFYTGYPAVIMRFFYLQYAWHGGLVSPAVGPLGLSLFGQPTAENPQTTQAEAALGQAGSLGA